MEPESQDRRRDRVWGLLIVGAAFLAALCISWWARGISSPSDFERPAPPTKDGVAGYPKAVDAVANLEAARGLTKRADLKGFVATGVRSDGMVDVSAKGNTIRYTFTSTRGEGPQPLHPPGTLPKHAFCGKQGIRLNGDGIGAEPDLTGLPCPQNAEPLPTPRCGPKQVWQAAIHHGFPADQPATVEYFRAVGGPAWKFDQPGAHKALVVYGDCERELSGAEATPAML